MGKVKNSKMFEDAKEQEEKFQESLNQYTEDFFDEDTSENLIVDDSNVERVLRKCNKISKEIEKIKSRQKNSFDFYTEEIKKTEKQLKYQHNCLRSFLSANKKKTMKFPNGTISTRKTTKHLYNGEQESLLKWCVQTEKKYQSLVLTTTTIKPSRLSIIKFIKDSGFAPDGWEIEESESFNVKTQGE